MLVSHKASCGMGRACAKAEGTGRSGVVVSLDTNSNAHSSRVPRTARTNALRAAKNIAASYVRKATSRSKNNTPCRQPGSQIVDLIRGFAPPPCDGFALIVGASAL